MGVFFAILLALPVLLLVHLFSLDHIGPWAFCPVVVGMINAGILWNERHCWDFWMLRCVGVFSAWFVGILVVMFIPDLLASIWDIKIFH